MNKLFWTTKQGDKIDLMEYKNKNHLENILKILKNKLKEMPYLELEISGSDSDGAYWSDQVIIRRWKKYNEERKLIKKYIKEINILINKL